MQGAHFNKIFSLMTRRGAAAVLFSGFCAVAVAGAGALEDGQSAYAHRDFDAALKLLQPLAQTGDAQAQATLGLMYNTGQGVAQDFESAIRWWRLSAVQGNALAQVNLGLAYGIQQKFDRAYVWLSAAAAQSYPNASVFRANFAERMTKEQLAQAQAKTQQCLSSGYKLCE
jgi:TPR repeat protein